MKKVFSIVLTLALAVTAFATVASAADSPEKVTGIITAVSSSGATVSVKNTTTADSVFDEALNALKKDNSALKIVDKKTLSVSGNNVTYPLSVDFTVSGLNASGKVYLLVKKADGTVATVEATVNGNKLTAAVPAAGEIALVAATSGSTSTGTSPKTADTAAPIALAVLALCAGAAFVSVKKIKA